MPATDDYLRSPKTMHQVFFASAVLLLAVTLWMMWADYNDEWRTFQRRAFAFQAQRDEAREAKIKNDPDFKKNVEALKQKVDAAAESVKTHKKDLEELDRKDPPTEAVIRAVARSLGRPPAWVSYTS